MKKKFNNLIDNVKKNKIQCDCNFGIISYLYCIKDYKDTLERDNLNMEKIEGNYKSGELSESEKTFEENKKDININDTATAKPINFEKNYRKRKIDSVHNKEDICVDYSTHFCNISDACSDYKKERHVQNNTNRNCCFNHISDSTNVHNIKLNENLFECNNICRINKMTGCEHNNKRETFEEEEEKEKNITEDVLIKEHLLCNKGNCCCITNTFYLEINEYLRKLHIYKLHRKC